MQDEMQTPAADENVQAPATEEVGEAATTEEAPAEGGETTEEAAE
jgi:hypothetical protein